MISLAQAVELVLDASCEDLETFTELVNAEHGSRYDDDDLADLWNQVREELGGQDLDLPDDTR